MQVFQVGQVNGVGQKPKLSTPTIPNFYSNNHRYEVTKYRHPDWSPDRPAIPLLQRHSIGLLVDEILTANELDQYTSILEIGKSGSGKSTLTGTLAHRLHQKFPYTVKWFEKKDIQNFVQIVKKLPKTPHIIVFQDASYALNGLGDEEIEEIAAQLTFIRHNTQSRIIVIIQIHYSKAIEKFFRDTDITICTSITDNERTNIKGLYGEHNAFKVDRFIKQYHDQKFKKRFKVKTSTWQKGGYAYKTNDPFRIALVSSIGECHSLLYPKELCAQCAEPKKQDLFSKMTPQQAVEFMVKACGGDLNNLEAPKTKAALATLRTTSRQYMFVNKGRKLLTSHVASAWNTLAELDHNVSLDWDGYWDEILKTCVLPRKTGYRFSKRGEVRREIEKFKSYETTKPSEVLTQKPIEEPTKDKDGESDKSIDDEFEDELIE